MKHRSILLLLPLFLLSACGESGSDEPILKMTGLYLNDDVTNYSRHPESLPLLAAGDVLDMLFTLDGNGNELRTFMVTNETSHVKTTLFFQIDEVSDEFTNIPEGILGFTDGIQQTGLTVKAAINAITEEEITLSFYLFSKAADCGGACVSVVLKTIN